MLKDAHYQMTFCCEATAKVIRFGLAVPTWRMRDGEMQPALAYGDPITVIYLYYCPNCGKKVQVTPMPVVRYTIFQREAK